VDFRVTLDAVEEEEEEERERGSIYPAFVQPVD
jgi:hypothetical protein